ncbi:hypothetical protein HU200_025963 [Digitaria exilis]|uniref:RING-type E3 ubiquitin transferase n=1 Tax=Digitaria exilis TaxID=1010633 RepID=A0A835C3X1_9POAL|nr:hypothetical protein HU200_025963 [Digitaria exilis]
MVAALLSFTTLFILLGAVAVVAALFAVFWAARRCWDGGVSPATDKHQGLLNKDVVVDVPVTVGGGGGGQQRSPSRGDGDDVELCPICKARLGEAGWGGTQRLRPCGHAYHADCIGLWLKRRWICPVCRASVAVHPAEIFDAMV